MCVVLCSKQQLANYVYVQECLKLDKDICVDLMEQTAVNQELLREVSSSYVCE